MHHRRHLTVVGGEEVRLDAQHPLLQLPVAPHGDIMMVGAVAALDGDRLGQRQHVPEVAHPGAGADDQLVAGDAPLVGLDGGHGLGVVAELEAGDGDAGDHPHAQRLGLVRQAVDGGGVVGVAALLLVQHRGDALGLPVIEEALHVALGLRRALDEDRVVADGLLLAVDRGDVFVHHLRGDLHVADGVIAEGLGIALPDRHRVCHELAHGRLEVVIAHHPAGDAAGPGGDAALVDHQDIPAAALPPRFQRLCQVPGGRETVDAGTDDHGAAAVGKRHGTPPERFAAAD